MARDYPVPSRPQPVEAKRLDLYLCEKLGREPTAGEMIEEIKLRARTKRAVKRLKS